MAATDMKKAGLEPGCEVELRCDPNSLWAERNWTEKYRAELEHLRSISETWTVDRIFEAAPDLRGMLALSLETGAQAMPVAPGGFQRTYDDAQTARQRRFNRLFELFPGDTGVPEENDTIERFVCVQRNEDPTSDDTYAFLWGDTFEEAVSEAGGEILVGWFPRGVYDLDTGQKVEVHVSSPVITKSEDQGATVNELDPGAVAEAEQFARHNYDDVAQAFTVSITVPPDRGDELATLLDAVCSASWIEQANVRRDRIRQYAPASGGETA